MPTLELEKSITFKNILVATDFSEASTNALHCAAQITEVNAAQLFIVHALSPEPLLGVPLDPLPASTDRELSEAKLNVEKAVSTELIHHLHPKEIVARGPIREVVLDAIQRNKIDLLVLGTHGRTGIRKIVLGSISENLFRRAPCPVLTVGPSAEPPRQIRKVLFATDFGPASVQALPYALDFANKTEGELTLLHLAPPMPVEYVGPNWYPGTDVVERERVCEEACLRQLQKLLPADSGLKCKLEYRVEFHFAPEGIIDTAAQRNADLIVMGVRESGTNASRVAAHMPWAIAYDVVCHAQCPVLTIRA
jgi:nucleotide-binding universal stress UspA family protein